MDAATAWLKVLHIVTLATWAAGLFYLPGLLAAHVHTRDLGDFHRLRAMTRIAYLGIVSPAALIAILSGTALIYVAGAHGGWLALKLTAVALMVAFHVFCGALVEAFREPPVGRRPALLLSLVVIPAVLVPTVLWLVLGKPI